MSALQVTKVAFPQNKISLKAPYAMPDPKYGSTVHETGNWATAMSEISYMIGNSSSTSFHVAVDDERAVEGVPQTRNAFHAGDGGNGNGNRLTVSIEICFNFRNGKTTKSDPVYDAKYKKARANAIEYLANWHAQKNIVPIKGKTVHRHYDWSKKNCPQRMIEEGYWDTFCSLVAKRYVEIKGGNKMSKPGKDVMRCINYLTIYEKPTTKSKILKYKKADSTMTVDGYVYGEKLHKNNYWWYKVEGGFAYSGDFQPKIDLLYLDKSNNL